ncbi:MULTISPECIES: flagellar protein FlaG [Lysinibacillus]|jgi:flagellar protein FlaG|uniref:Flagellar biosynthesis protein FlaG n=1 Tax=Lysinibacillus fusiformis TaxID=28031 RepID=A0A2I0V5L5_9BACI|nr:MULTISPECIES: flagellar protein FlaG [Lysinibacillus]PKU53609.1 flagellar biosynthesis protein FlaG [Lysinibacillus fusiformis]WCH48430.1 flagellar protein FlaG [Lysinibacillus sp. OF-1]SCZ08019.1 flagellar protein FlaG [Lysinibacillus sp. SG9]SDB52834.1 flagellar protein FlaG [Lysinibacillus sp. TC-37]SFT17115.1 flagellar protein FlaG [Lysinibacillus sp. SG55]
MRIAAQGQSTDVGTATSSTSSKKAIIEETTMTTIKSQLITQSQGEKIPVAEGQEVSKEKLQNVVDTVNEFLQINHNASKFVLHDGLDRYFVQVVDTQTEEVVKEIPPKKLLDAYYEMQKLLGMIVDEKI